MKSGTTSLFFTLGQRHDVSLSTVKEPFYFTGRGDGEEITASTILDEVRIRDLDSYESIFGRAPWRVEASALYLGDSHAARLIRDYDPRMKLVFILRDPVERAVSNFNFMRVRGEEPLPDLGSAIVAEPERMAAGGSPDLAYVGQSSYGTNLRRFFEAFPREQILVLSFERFRDSPQEVLAEVERFAGMEPHSYDHGVAYNAGGEIRSAGLERLIGAGSPALRGRLRGLLPKRIHQHLVRLRAANRSTTATAIEGVADSARQRLREVLAPEVAELERLVGPELTAGWSVAADEASQ